MKVKKQIKRENKQIESQKTNKKEKTNKLKIRKK